MPRLLNTGSVFRSAAFGLLICALAIGPRLHAQQDLSESQLKAAFIFNFLKFTEWSGPPRDASEPIRLCLISDDSLYAAIKTVTSGKEVSGHPLIVRNTKPQDDLSTCHALFIGGDKKGLTVPALVSVDGKRVLTIGESDGFVEAGGIINLVRRNNRIRFQINPRAAARAGLTLRSALLSLAEIHEPGISGTGGR